MFVFVKVIGIAMILTGCTMIGITVSGSFVRRIHELQDIKSFLAICETSMNDIGMHTPEILRQSQAYLKTEVKAFLKSVSNRLQSEYPDSLAKIWKEEIEVHRHKLSLTEQDLRVLADIGSFLGTTGPESQRKLILRITGLLDKHMEDAEALRSKNQKIMLNMGVLGGLVLVLILL
jgi:stage III sporulation protein AB